MVDSTNVIWAEPLPPGTLAQKAELIALTKALELGASKKINIYMDSRYAFATAHIYHIYQERGVLTSEGKEIKKQAGNLGSDEASNCEYSLPRTSKGKRLWPEAITRQIKWLEKWLCRSLSWLWACKRHLLGNGTGLRDGLT